VLIKKILESDPEIKVIGTARNGEEAIRLIHKLKPDVVTLDYEMPVKTGLEVLEEIMKKEPVPCIMVSAYTFEGAEVTLKALSKGAFDFIPKPSGSISMDIEKIQHTLIEKVKHAHKVSKEKLELLLKKPQKIKERKKIVEAIGIVSSTGGPKIIEYILTNLRDIRVPIFIVQHMPSFFTKIFADRLREFTNKSVFEAQHEQKVKKGLVYIAPGGIHLKLVKKNKDVFIHLFEDKPKGGVKPSGDYLLFSIAEIYGNKSMAIILTGMGKDGSEGARKIKEKGGVVIVQDKKSSLIFSMPCASKEFADFSLPPDKIVEKIEEYT
jgi:two-component system chemotaxis response regulator CheB